MPAYLADGFADEVLAGGQEAGVAEAVEQKQVAHHDAGDYFRQGTGSVFETLARSAFDGCHVVEAPVLCGSLAQHFEAVLPFGIRLSSQSFGHAGVVALDLLEICAAGDAFHGCHDLQLAGTFIDGKDAGVAVEAFAGIFLHEAAATVNLYAVVGAAVGEFAGA